MSTATKKVPKENAAPRTTPFGFPLCSAVAKAAAELAKNAQTVLADNPLSTTPPNGLFQGSLKTHVFRNQTHTFVILMSVFYEEASDTTKA